MHYAISDMHYSHFNCIQMINSPINVPRPTRDTKQGKIIFVKCGESHTINIDYTTQMQRSTQWGEEEKVR